MTDAPDPGAVSVQAEEDERMTIVEFLEARLAEDFDAAYSAREHFEAIAKRALIDKFKDADLGAPYTESPEVDHWDDWQVACYEVLSKLALVYCRHPDYRPEWLL